MRSGVFTAAATLRYLRPKRATVVIACYRERQPDAWGKPLPIDARLRRPRACLPATHPHPHEPRRRGAKKMRACGAELARLLPAAAWLPRYERRWLRADVTAGIAVTALVVPEEPRLRGHRRASRSRTGSTPPPPARIIYALFCTSRHISTGPSSSLAAVAGGAVLVTGLGGEEAAQLVAAIALATGLLFLLLALFRLGWIAQFLSKAVITGFLAGAAVDVVIGELPKLTGTSAEGDNAWRELASWLSVARRRRTGRRCSSASSRSR